MKTILLFLLLVTPYICKADNPRWSEVFTSPNDKYELRLVSEYGQADSKWSLVEKATQKVKYQLTGPYLFQMSLVVSDDGNSVVAIDDFSEQEAVKNLDILFFYNKGKLIKKYTLEEINGMDAISYSASHFSWLLPSNLDLIIKDSEIEFTTYRLFHYKFDVNTGKILRKELDSRLTEDSIYVYGKIVEDLGNDRYVMEVCTLIQGIIPESGKIEFESKTMEFSERDYSTIIVRNGKFVTATYLPLMNSCTYKDSK